MTLSAVAAAPGFVNSQTGDIFRRFHDHFRQGGMGMNRFPAEFMRAHARTHGSGHFGHQARSLGAHDGGAEDGAVFFIGAGIFKAEIIDVGNTADRRSIRPGRFQAG